MNNWTEIDATALTANYKAIQQVAQAEVLAVIKARAYGHGAELCAPILVRAGARWLGVTCASEGQRVRTALDHADLEADILIMNGFLPEDVPTILAARQTPVVWTQDHLALLAGTGCRVHVEVDTGMGRQGVPPGQDLTLLLRQIIAEVCLWTASLFTSAARRWPAQLLPSNSAASSSRPPNRPSQPA